MQILCDVMHRSPLGSISFVIVGTSLSFSPSFAWELGDRQAYNNKMAILKVMLEGARERAIATNDLETMCLIMSIGNDVTETYLRSRADDAIIKKRLAGMRNDLTACLALLYKRR